MDEKRDGQGIKAINYFQGLAMREGESAMEDMTFELGFNSPSSRGPPSIAVVHAIKCKIMCNMPLLNWEA